MRIAYVGRFGQKQSNQDEEAVTHALTELGHTVIPILEWKGNRALPANADLCLFNKWYDLDSLKKLDGRTARVFWYWDLVNWPDHTLSGRNNVRKKWMAEVLPNVELGFCTDGDWVAQDDSGKLCWLMQGADGRVVGPGKPNGMAIDILFTGVSRKGGRKRESFVEEVTARYGSRFRHVPLGAYGRQLADLIAGSKVVVAPDSPVTDRYWSNRVYLTLGFGGFLLHPYCDSLLTNHYADGKELVYYYDRRNLFDLIDHYLSSPGERRETAEAGLERTKKEHLYLHRCRKLLRIVKERLGVG